MKLYSKLSALGAVLVLSTAFASADTVVPILSGSGSVGYLGYSTTSGGAPVIQDPGVNNMPAGGCNVGRTECNVYSIDPGGVWAPAASDTTWVSYEPNSGPTGVEASFDANGFYTYTTNFNPSSTWTATITVLADDTTSILLNGVEILPEGFIGSDAKCADGAPNCRVGGSATITFSGEAGFNVLDFVVDQSGSNYQGLDFTGAYTLTPEPNTLILLGTGLLGSAGALFRKMRTAA